jgi:hypothetical protein
MAPLLSVSFTECKRGGRPGCNRKEDCFHGVSLVEEGIDCPVKRERFKSIPSCRTFCCSGKGGRV